MEIDGAKESKFGAGLGNEKISTIVQILNSSDSFCNSDPEMPVLTPFFGKELHGHSYIDFDLPPPKLSLIRPVITNLENIDPRTSTFSTALKARAQNSIFVDSKVAKDMDKENIPNEKMIPMDKNEKIDVAPVWNPVEKSVLGNPKKPKRKSQVICANSAPLLVRRSERQKGVLMEHLDNFMENIRSEKTAAKIKKVDAGLESVKFNKTVLADPKKRKGQMVCPSVTRRSERQKVQKENLERKKFRNGSVSSSTPTPSKTEEQIKKPKGGLLFRKKKLCKMHCKKIRELSFSELLVQFFEIKPRVRNIFEGNEPSARYSLYLEGPKSRNQLYKMNVTYPYDEEQILTLFQMLDRFLVWCPQDSALWSDFIKYVMLPETMIGIYAQMNDIPFSQAEDEMVKFHGEG